MRPHFVLVALLTTSCASNRPERVRNTPSPVLTKLTNIDLEAYSQPFGHAPEEPDLSAIFLSLPNALAADMPVEMRRVYIEEYGSDAFGYLFDAKHKFATYYSDNPYNPIRPSARFYIKVFPSDKYRYVVAIHMLKPSTSGLQNPPAPSPANTFFLAPSNSRWIDLTEQVLPKAVHRDWYFQPLRENLQIEAGPYEHDLHGGWREGQRVSDLVWKHDRFVAQTPASTKFSNDL